MRLPWQKPKTETRSQSYEQRLIEAIHAQASAEDASLSSTSQLQAISNSSRAVAGRRDRHAAESPHRWDYAKLSLQRRPSHSANWRTRRANRIRRQRTLRPASSWDIKGSSLNQSEWTYRLTFNVPDGQQKRRVKGNEVIHIRLPDAERPWQPGSAIGGTTASATAELESAIQTELAKAARGKLVHIPGYEDADPDDENDAWSEFQQDLRNAKGGTVMAPAPANLVQGIGAASAPPAFGTLKLAPEVAEDLQTLRDRLSQSIASTLSVLPGLLSGGESTGIREAQRVFHNLVLTPLGLLISQTLSEALDTSIELDFTRLQLGNLREKAQVAKALVDAGVEQPKALELAGLNS